MMLAHASPYTSTTMAQSHWKISRKRGKLRSTRHCRLIQARRPQWGARSEPQEALNWGLQTLALGRRSETSGGSIRCQLMFGISISDLHRPATHLHPPHQVCRSSHLYPAGNFPSSKLSTGFPLPARSSTSILMQSCGREKI